MSNQDVTFQSNITKAAFYYTLSTEVSPYNNEDAYNGMAEIYNLLGDQKTSEEFLQKAKRKKDHLLI